MGDGKTTEVQSQRSARMKILTRKCHEVALMQTSSKNMLILDAMHCLQSSGERQHAHTQSIELSFNAAGR